MITKQAIVDVALQLAEKKDIDKLTVTDIAKECHISRQTFYYHFQDVVDLLEWAMQQELDRMQKQAQSCSTVEEALLICCRNMKKRQWIFAKILNSRYYREGMKLMLEGMKRYLKSLAEPKLKYVEQPVKDTLFLADYHAGAIAMMFAQWMMERDVDMEAQVHQIMRIIEGDLCLQRPKESGNE